MEKGACYSSTLGDVSTKCEGPKMLNSSEEVRSAAVACDREPIRIPGFIQTYGLMLVATAQERHIMGTAGTLRNSWMSLPMNSV